MIGMFGMAAAAQVADKIGALGTQAARAESKVGFLEREAKILQANLAKALMISEALWEIMKDKHGLGDEELRKKVYEVDMRDGTLDGKNQRKAVECPNCRHMVSARHPACLYCGEVIDNSVFSL